MKKHNWRTLILLILFLISLIPVYYVISYNNKKDLEAEEAASSEKVFDIKSEDVTSLQFTLDGEQVVFKKVDDTWKLEGDDSFQVESSVVENNISEITEMTTDRVLQEVTDLAEYGLNQPVQTVMMTMQDGSSHTISFGDSNASTGNDYIYVDDVKTKVYTVSGSVAQAFEGTLDDYRAQEESTEDVTTESSETENTEMENEENQKSSEAASEEE